MEKAVAIRYHQDLPAPFIVAKGKKELAHKLVSIAEEHKIQILKQDELTERLFCLDVGSLIPENVYGLVAEILAFVYTSEQHIVGGDGNSSA
jgi:type III secretion system FlhB-like substrate exporter